MAVRGHPLQDITAAPEVPQKIQVYSKIILASSGLPTRGSLALQILILEEWFRFDDVQEIVVERVALTVRSTGKIDHEHVRRGVKLWVDDFLLQSPPTLNGVQ